MPRQYTLKALILLLLSLISFDVASSSDEIFYAIELTPNAENGKKIWPLCAACHHDNGWGKPDGSFPVIAGQHRRVLIKQLADIRSKERQNPVMYPFTDPETIGGAQAISDLAAYIASLPGDPEPGVGNGKQLDLGKSLYQEKCSQCHGDQAQGNDESYIPKLKGQHYSYLLRQIQWISNGFRKNSNPVMVMQVKTMSAQEIEAVADYVSRL